MIMKRTVQLYGLDAVFNVNINVVTVKKLYLFIFQGYIQCIVLKTQ